MNRIHLMIDDSTLEILNYYKKNKKIPYSRTVENFIKIANDRLMIIDEVNDMSGLIKNLKANQYLIIDLLKQLYSDLEIENSTNPNKNLALKEFFYKRKVGHDD